MSKAVLNVLTQMQIEMEHLSLWQTVPPSEDQFQSDVPFCMNTMTCTTWLQWVYIARLRALIEGEGSLPKGAKVLPYAEEAFKVEGIKSKSLLDIIAKLDILLA